VTSGPTPAPAGGAQPGYQPPRGWPDGHAYLEGVLSHQQRHAVRHYLRKSAEAREFCSRLLKARSRRPGAIVSSRPHAIVRCSAPVGRNRIHATRVGPFLTVGASVALVALAGIMLIGHVKTRDSQAAGYFDNVTGDGAPAKIVVEPPYSAQGDKARPTPRAFLSGAHSAGVRERVIPSAPGPVLPRMEPSSTLRGKQEGSVTVPPDKAADVPLPQPGGPKPVGAHAEAESKPASVGPEMVGSKAISFAKDIWPIFEAKCAACHGKDKRNGSLDVRTVAAIRNGGDSGPGLVPGMPEKSLLWDDISTDRMPPRARDRLTKAEKELVRHWIAGGAREKAVTTATSTPENGSAKGSLPPQEVGVKPRGIGDAVGVAKGLRPSADRIDRGPD
jgi:hypothetical protein